jgi:hypothetical protein
VAARVDLAGVQCEWRSASDEALEQWISSLPWCRGDGVRCIALGGSQARSHLMSWLTQRFEEVASLHGGISVRTFDVSPSRPYLRSAILSVLSLQELPDRHRVLTLLSDECSLRPYLVVAEVDGLRAGAVMDECEELVTDYWKAARPDTAMGLAFCVLSNSTVEGRSFDLRCLEPLTPATWLESTSLETWRWYLHLRIAWEVGGALEDALTWSDRLGGLQTSPPNDERFEDWLNARSRSFPPWDPMCEHSLIRVRIPVQRQNWRGAHSAVPLSE